MRPRQATAPSPACASWRTSCGYAAAMAGRRVLVVDDDPAIRHVVASILVEAGYDAQTAVDGDHGVRSALALHPALIILDIHVPEKAMALRFAQVYRDRVTADTRAPIIVMSGASDLMETGQQIGADGFLKKPFEIDELLQLVTKYLPDPVAQRPAEPVGPPDAVPDSPEAATPIVQPGTSTA